MIVVKVAVCICKYEIGSRTWDSMATILPVPCPSLSNVGHIWHLSTIATHRPRQGAVHRAFALKAKKWFVRMVTCHWRWMVNYFSVAMTEEVRSNSHCWDICDISAFGTVCV